MEFRKKDSVAMSKTNEHRRALRQSCLVPIDSKAGSPFSNVRTVDISRGGIGFVSQCALPLRKKIAVELLLTPDADPVLVMGEVRWVKPVADGDLFRVGMKFIRSVAEGGRARLKQYFRE